MNSPPGTPPSGRSVRTLRVWARAFTVVIVLSQLFYVAATIDPASQTRRFSAATVMFGVLAGSLLIVLLASFVRQWRKRAFLILAVLHGAVAVISAPVMTAIAVNLFVLGLPAVIAWAMTVAAALLCWNAARTV